MEPINFQSLSTEDKKKFLASIDTIVSDCDGVIWNPKGIIDNAHIIINKLTEQGKTIYFLTNNSTKTREQFLTKFEKLGFAHVKVDAILSTAYLTAIYLKDNLPSGKLVYVIGSSAIVDELRKYNIKSFGPGKDEITQDIFDSISTASIEIRDNVGAVVVGFDICISYMKVLKATTYLKNKNCLFVATNPDETFPSALKYVLPGAGSILAPVKVASGQEPFVIGKPSAYVAEVLKGINVDPKRTLFIGDRLNTDILTGKKCLFKTLLVLTGTHNLDDVKRYLEFKNVEDQMFIPDFYTNSIADF